MIFHLTLPNNRWDIHHSHCKDIVQEFTVHKMYMVQVIRIAHVCSQWRALGLSTPTLWTHLVFTCERPKEIEIAKVWLNRSAASPITFKTHYRLVDIAALDPNQPWGLINLNHNIFHTVFGLILDHCRQWQSVYLGYMLDALKAASTKIIDNLPELQHIQLVDSKNPKVSLLSVFCTAPKLQNFLINSGFDEPMNTHSIPIPWNQLTSLNF